MNIDIENIVFNSLSDYINDVATLQSSNIKNDSLTPLSKNLFKIREEGIYTVFFLCSDTLLDILEASDFPDKLNSIINEGFFLLSHIKTNIAIGKGYKVNYCRDDVRIISRNLSSYGYIFITTTASLSRVEEGLITCQLQEMPEDYESSPKNKRLVELFPGLFTIFNKQDNCQALLSSVEEN